MGRGPLASREGFQGVGQDGKFFYKEGKSKNVISKQKKQKRIIPGMELSRGRSKVSYHSDYLLFLWGVERTQVADSLALVEKFLTDQLRLPF